MKRVIRAAVCLLVVFSATAILFAKGTTTKIVITGDQLAYVVSYAVDWITGKGYVYLPGRADAANPLNTKSIYRGREGNWFRATAAWQSAFGKIVEASR